MASEKSKKKDLKILYTNARSIIAKIDEVRALLVDQNPDIFAVTETWTHSNVHNSYLNVPGYDIAVRKDRADTTDGRGGGLLIYTKKELVFYEIETPTDIVQAASIKVQLKDINLDVHLLYRSPNSSSENNDKINQFINTVGEFSILIGDLNYPSINWNSMTSNLAAKKFLDTVLDKFLIQHVDFCTHNNGNILDLVLSNIPNLIQSVKDTGKLGNSDHILIETVVESPLLIHNKDLQTWDYKKANFEALRNDLHSMPWNDLLKGDIEEDWATFKSLFSNLCDSHVPKKLIKELTKPPWLKPDTLRLIRQKRAAWTRYRRTQLNEDHNFFKILEKRVKKSVKKAKHNHEVNIAKNAKSNPKMFYSYLNGKKQNKPQIGPILDKHGNLCHEDQEKANIFNAHYSGVFTSEDPILPEEPVHKDCPEMDDMIFSTNKINEIIDQLSNSTAAGPDGLSQRIIKEVSKQISYPLCKLFKKSMETSQIPNEWKQANVKPIFKKGAKTLPINYRPISLTCVIVKIMERAIKESIMAHLISKSLLNPSQHGFLPKKSVSTNLNSFLDFVTKNVDAGHPVDVLYLDFSKAFDKVPHKRLIQKLKCYKINHKVTKWIENWLSRRKQMVTVNGASSEWVDVVSSVVQGSVLGPVLFLIYIDDIDYCLGHYEGFMSKFADDTKVAKVIDSEVKAQELQSIISNLQKWCENWGMNFNIDKCSVIHFGQQNRKYEYTMNNQVVSSNSSQRDLGVILSETSKPSIQCATAAKKANQVLGRITKAFTCYKKDTMLLIYKAFVRPHLEHAVTAWSPWLRKDIDLIEAVQHRATRRMSDVHGSYAERLSQLRLQSLEERRKRGDAIEVYKYLHCYHNQELFKVLSSNRPSTRHLQSYKPLYVPRARLDIRKNFFSIRGAELWNHLPSEVRQSVSVNAFKNAYDRHITD